MCAAAGLGIESNDLHHTYLPICNRRLGLKRSEQILPLKEFCLRDVICCYSMILLQHSVNFSLQVNSQGSAEIFQFEIDPGIVFIDLHAGDPAIVIMQCNGVEDVQDSVIAHQGQPPGFVENQPCLLANEIWGRIRFAGVPQDIFRICMDGNHFQSFPALESDYPLIRWLSAPTGVKAGLIQRNLVFLDGKDCGFRFEAMIIP